MSRCTTNLQYDKSPYHKNAVLLKSSYISEAGDTLEQLCALLPLNEWDEVLSCKQGEFWCCTQIVAPWNVDNDPETGARAYSDPRERVRDRLTRFCCYIFPNDPHEARRQMVIVRRKSTLGALGMARRTGTDHEAITITGIG
jgi:hypothetical protein